VDGDASDRDGDGLEDVALRVTLEGGSAPLEPGPRVAATLAWLDRPAGLSRDLGATESSFAFALRASRGPCQERPGCGPGAGARRTDPCALARGVRGRRGTAAGRGGGRGDGAIRCGSTRALEDAGLAEVRAYVTLGDALRAALALDRAERSPASRTPARAAEGRAWIEQLAPPVLAHAVRAIAAVPQSGKGHEPAWGALAFEAGGALLVRTRAGVVRVDPDAGDETSADGVTVWPAAVSAPDGTLRWNRDVRRLRRGGPPRDVRRRGRHARRRAPDRAIARRALHRLPWGACARARGGVGGGRAGGDHRGPVSADGPETGQASLLAAPLDSPALRGAPRSPDGKVLVVSTSVGFLMRRGSRARLLRAPELEGSWAEQRDCAVSNDEAHVACVRAGKAWVGVWEAP